LIVIYRVIILNAQKPTQIEIQNTATVSKFQNKLRLVINHIKYYNNNSNFSSSKSYSYIIWALLSKVLVLMW